MGDLNNKNYFEKQGDNFQKEFRNYLMTACPRLHPVSIDGIASYARYMFERYQDQSFRLLNALCADKLKERKD